MTDPKKPQDRLPKKADDRDNLFTFTTGGVEYTMKRDKSFITPGYNRRRRHLDTEDRLWGILETMADGDEEILNSFDDMTDAEWEKLQLGLAKYLGATLGE